MSLIFDASNHCDITKNMQEEFKKLEKRTLSEITSLNDNGDYLVDLLKLKDLKASQININNGHTEAINSSGTIQFEMIKEGGYITKSIKKLSLEDNGYQKYPLVDLGSDGETGIIIFAQRIGVAGIVAVDIQNQIELDSLDNLKKSEEYKKEFPVLGLKMDMLELLEQLPNNSCNISLFYIDDCIIKSEKYKRKLIKEIYRVVPKDGLIINLQSIMEDMAEKYPEEWEDLIGGGYVFKKVVNPIS